MGKGGEAEGENLGRPRGAKPAKPARTIKEGAHCARVTRLPSRHVAQRPRRCQKNSSRSRSCSWAHRARVAATHARAPARAVGRRNGGSNTERRGPPNPKRFQPETILPPPKARFSSSFRSLQIYGPFCPCLTPQVSQTTCPPTKSVSNPKRVCQPGSFAPPPHNLIASPPPPPFAVCQVLSERPRPVYSARLSV